MVNAWGVDDNYSANFTITLCCAKIILYEM